MTKKQLLITTTDNLKKIVLLALLISTFGFVQAQKIQADEACGTGSTCTGNNTYLRVLNCTTRFGYCANLEIDYNALVSCPTGGSAGSCVGNAPGKEGCIGQPSTTVQDCTCSLDLSSCSIHNSACPDYIYYECSQSGQSCNVSEVGQLCTFAPPYDDVCQQVSLPQICQCTSTDPQCTPVDGTLGCCASCSTDCTGKCGQNNDCGEYCGDCTLDCNYTSNNDCNAPCDGTGTESWSSSVSGCTPTIYQSCNGPACGCGSITWNPCTQPCGPETQTGFDECANPYFRDCNNDPCVGESCAAGEITVDVNPDVCRGGNCGDCFLQESQQRTSPTGSLYCSDNCTFDASCCSSVVDGWWQALNAHVYAGLNTGTALRSIIPGGCGEPACIPALLAPDFDLVSGSDGFPLTGGGSIETLGFTTYRQPNVSAIGTKGYSRVKENFTWFSRRYGVDTSSAQGSINPGDAQKPTGGLNYYYVPGDMTIDQAWNVDGETIVIFVGGNLTISDSGGVEALIDVRSNPNPFLAFIASGNIIIDETVGNTDPANTTANIEGVFVADGRIIVQSDGDGSTQDKRFIGEGTFVGWNGVTLERSFAPNDAANQTTPAETFRYRPDLIVNTPDTMKTPRQLWQEAN